MSGAGFFFGTTSPASTVEPRGALGADRVLEHRPHRRLGRRRGDRQLPARVERLRDDPRDARAARAARPAATISV